MRKGMIPTIVGAVFAVVGLVFVAIAVLLLVSSSTFIAAAEHAEGQVIDVDIRDRVGTRSSGSWYPIVEFRTPSGERVRFKDAVGRESGAYRRGDRVPVAYDPDNPREARVATFGSLYGFGVLGGILGGVATVVGGVLLVVGIRSLRVRRWLLRHGRRIQGHTTFVGLDRQTTVNGRHPYIVRAGFDDPETGRSYIASSDHVWEDPEPTLAQGSTVTVLFDPKKPKRCTVDLGTGAATR